MTACSRRPSRVARPVPGRTATALALGALALGALLGGSAPAPAAGLPALDPALPDVSRAGPRGTACPEGATRVEPGQRIQAVVDRSLPGTAFCIGAGRHRGQTIAPKSGQRFFGEPGAVLDGTVDVTGFVRDGDAWVAPGPAPELRRDPASDRRCLPTSPACGHPEIVLFDGVPLTRVLDDRDLRSGRFLIDAARRIRIADDPAGHRVAASAAAYAFLTHGARDVTVADLTVERYGNLPQRGAIFDDQDGRATGWLVEHNQVRLNSGLGILTGPGARILANRVEDNGQLGISASRYDGLIEGNLIAGNNTRGFDPSWEAGGLKAAVAKGLVIRGNHVHGNHGPGLWCDIDCRDVVLEGNLVESNDGAGIFYEISFAGTIRGNTLRFNGLTQGDWYWGADILLSASQDVVVEDNLIVVAEGGTGIALVDQARPRDAGGLYRTAGNRISSNEVRFSGRRTARMGGVDDVPPDSPNARVIETGDNRFDDNLYAVPPGGTVAFGWGRGPAVDFAGFQARGQDVHSRAVTAEGE